MGSFNVLCGVSGLNIQYDEPCTIIRLAKNKYWEDLSLHTDGWYKPTYMPVKAIYNDYGRFEIIEDSPSSRWFFPLELIDGKYVGNDQFMAVHQSIYDSLSQNIYNSDDTFNGREFQSNDYFQKLFDKIRDEVAKSRIKGFWYGTLMCVSDNFVVNRTPFRGANSLGNIIYQEGLEILTDNFAEELTKYSKFYINMMILQKKFYPSYYASQTDRVDIHKELYKLMDVVFEEKKIRYEEFE